MHITLTIPKFNFLKGIIFKYVNELFLPCSSNIPYERGYLNRRHEMMAFY